jgi:hypothetical protein
VGIDLFLLHTGAKPHFSFKKREQNSRYAFGSTFGKGGFLKEIF